MGETMPARVAAILNDLSTLPLDQEDRSLITQILLSGLVGKEVIKTPEPASLNKLARDIFQVSHQRNEALGESCCPDPEWNMLLELTTAHTECRPIDVTSLCAASGVPTTTALRHIERMSAVGLISRKASTSDRRRTWVDITPRALSATEKLLRQVYRAG